MNVDHMLAGDGPVVADQVRAIDGKSVKRARDGDTLGNDNLHLFRYLTADESDSYLAIMRVATSSLLADLSAADIVSAAAGAGYPMEVDTAEQRCRQLVTWGNLIRSVRDTRVTTIAAYNRSRSRYQVSKLGGRVHRDAEAILAAGDGAREVAREVLAQMAANLSDIAIAVKQAHLTPLDSDVLARRVTSIFSDQRLFTESVTDFYAYLSSVLSRYDLAGDEYAQFKDLLIGYIDMIKADVARNAPVILDRLTTLMPLIGVVVAALPAALEAGDLFTVERLPGRAVRDWEQLAAWYGAGDDASGPEQLRTAAGQALRQLLANAKRILTPTGTGVTRRADFLKLAGWFATADSDTAHRMFDAAFGAYSSRHLALGPDVGAPTGHPGDSWWESDPVDVPLSMRELGDRAARGRTGRIPDVRAQAAALLRQATEKLQERQAAAAQLAATGALHGATLTPLARRLLLDTLARLLVPHVIAASAVPQVTDTELGFVLTASPAADAMTVVNASDGQLIVHGYRLSAAPAGWSTDSVEVADGSEVSA